MTRNLTQVELGPFRDHCRSCSKPILWAMTRNDRPMPVNPTPSDAGNVLLARQNGVLRGQVLNRGQADGARAAGAALHTPHWRDCPNADDHRRTRRRAGDPR